MTRKGHSTKALALRIIQLIAERERAGLQEAVELLKSYYPEQPAETERAYELACVLAVRRLMDRKTRRLSLEPEADWLAIRAAQASQEGDLSLGFSSLRGACRGGARPELCRAVALELLDKLSRKDRVAGLQYTPAAVVSFEVGRICGSGLVIVANRSSRIALSDWEATESAQEQPGVFLRSLEEVRDDCRRACLGIGRVGKARSSLERIDWARYLGFLKRQGIRGAPALAAI